jgi:hypothetical protein
MVTLFDGTKVNIRKSCQTKLKLNNEFWNHLLAAAAAAHCSHIVFVLKLQQFEIMLAFFSVRFSEIHFLKDILVRIGKKFVSDFILFFILLLFLKRKVFSFSLAGKECDPILFVIYDRKKTI